MQKIINNGYWIYFFIALISILFIFLLPNVNNDTLINLWGFPYLWIGDILRTLSLHGGIQNILTWILYILFSLFPIFVFAYLRWKNKLVKMDYVLLVLSLILFFLLYVAINPSLLELLITNPLITNPTFVLVLLCLFFDSFTICYILFRYIKVSLSSNTSKLVYYLQWFIFSINAIFLFKVFFIDSRLLITEWQVITAMAIQPISKVTTYAMTITAYIINSLPTIAAVGLLHLVIGLLEEMKHSTFGSSVLNISKKITRYCTHTLLIILLLTCSYNMASLLTINHNYTISIRLDVPIEFIGLSIASLIIAKRISLSHQLKQENDLFI